MRPQVDLDNLNLEIQWKFRKNNVNLHYYYATTMLLQTHNTLEFE